MALRELLLPWTQQPQEAVEPSDAALTEGLIGLWLPHQPINLVDGVQMTPIGNLTIGARQAGLSVITGGYGYPQPVNAADPAAAFDSPVMTAMLIAQQDAPANSTWGFFRGQGSSHPAWGLGLHGGSYNGALARIGSWSVTLSPGYSTTVPRVILMRADGSRVWLYVDGRMQETATYTWSTPQYGSDYRRLLFGSVNGTIGQQNIRPALGAYWARCVSHEYALAVSASREAAWGALFAPQRILVPVSGGGAGTGDVTGVLAAATSSTALGAPAGTQQQQGAAAPASSTTSLAVPAGTQVQTSAIAAGVSATAGSTTAGTQAQAGAISPATSATTDSAPAGRQTHTAAVSPAVSATSGSTVAATQTQVGAVAPGVSATSGSEPAGAVPGSTAVAPGSSATALSTAAGTQVQRGIVSGGVSATTGSSVSATQTQTGGSVSACVSSTAGASPAATQDQAGAVQSSSSTTALSTVAAGMAGGPAIAPALSSTALATIAGTQLQLGIVAPMLLQTRLQSIAVGVPWIPDPDRIWLIERNVRRWIVDPDNRRWTIQ